MNLGILLFPSMRLIHRPKSITQFGEDVTQAIKEIETVIRKLCRAITNLICNYRGLIKYFGISQRVTQLIEKRG